MSVQRHSHGICYYEGFVYVFGGCQSVLFYGNPTNKCERYSIKDDCWENVDDLAIPLGDVGATVMDTGKIMVFGRGSKELYEIS
mmetsp:Transcript_8432/g.1152  ORF Transcript_8432/g.1152 Transcript_8432/m.1152 type:complete len:84 (-) Transcript_8432:271-522(-)